MRALARLVAVALLGVGGVAAGPGRGGAATLQNGGDRSFWEEGDRTPGTPSAPLGADDPDFASWQAVGRSDVSSCLGRGSETGQAFRPQETPLERLDLTIRVRDARGHGRLRLWQWPASLPLDAQGFDALLALPPLFEDEIPMTSQQGAHRVQIRPRDGSGQPLAVDPARTYFLLLEARDGAYYDVRSVDFLDPSAPPPAGDPDPAGAMWRCPDFVSGEDLWLRLYGASTPGSVEPTLPAGEIRDPTPSDWWPPLDLVAPVTADTYRERVEAYIDANGWCVSGAAIPAHPERRAFDCAARYLACLEGGEAACDDFAQRAGTLLDAAAADCVVGGTYVCQVHFSWLPPPALAWLWIPPVDRSPQAGELLELGAREFLRIDVPQHAGQQPDGGLWNHASRSALVATLAVRLFCGPGAVGNASAQECAEWNQLAVDLFGLFFDAMETEEDAGNYHVNHWLPPLLATAQLAPAGVLQFDPASPLAGRNLDQVLWSDPRFRALVERFFEHTIPVGAYPNFGDGTGQGGGEAGLIWLFERAAREYGEPRFRAMARRLYRFGEERARDGRSFGAPGDDAYALDWLNFVFGWLNAEDPPGHPPPEDVLLPPHGAPGADGWGSRVTWRTQALPRASPDVCPDPAVSVASACPVPRVHYDLACELAPFGVLPCTPALRALGATPHRVPDKLVLRSGLGEDDLHAVFDLVGGYHHGHPEVGALVSLVAGGSLLLTETAHPYAHFQDRPHPRLRPYDHRDYDHSLPVLRRHAGGALRPGASRTPAGVAVELTDFQDGPSATVAAFAWDDPRGFGVRQERRVLFAKNGFLLVRDGFTFPAERDPMEVSVGPVWHAAGVREQDVAGGWFDVYQNAPVAQRWLYRNPEQYALIRFQRRGLRYRVGAFREPAYAPPTLETRPECGPRISPVTTTPSLDCHVAPPYVLYQRWIGDTAPGPDRARWFDTLIVPHDRPDAQAVRSRIRQLGADRFSIALEVVTPDGTRWTLVDNPRAPQPVTADRVATDATSLVVREGAAGPPELVYTDATFVVVDGNATTWTTPTSGYGVLTPAACDDGLDNDGDGLIDLADPGCRDASFPREDPACDDGLDNDGDLRVDAADPQCRAPWDGSEQGCGAGFAQAGLWVGLAWTLRPRPRSRRRAAPA